MAGQEDGLFFFNCFVMDLVPVAASHSPLVPLRYLHEPDGAGAGVAAGPGRVGSNSTTSVKIYAALQAMN